MHFCQRTLKKFNIGETFTSMINMIYDKPLTYVTKNSQLHLQMRKIIHKRIHIDDNFITKKFNILILLCKLKNGKILIKDLQQSVC